MNRLIQLIVAVMFATVKNISSDDSMPCMDFATSNYCHSHQSQCNSSVTVGKQCLKTCNRCHLIRERPIADTDEGLFNFPFGGPCKSEKLKPTVIASDSLEFAVRLYQQLAADEQRKDASFVFSPSTLSAGLALLYSGTKPELRSAFRKVAFSGVADGNVDRVYRSLVAALNVTHVYPGMVLYAHSNNGPTGSFQSTAFGCYRCPVVVTSDLQYDPKAAVKSVAVALRSVNHKTVIMDDYEIPRSTKLLQASTFTYRSRWHSDIQDHHVTKWINGKAVMRIKSFLNSYDSHRLQATLVALPFRGRQQQLYVLIPKGGVDFANVEKRLTSKQLAAAVSGTREKFVDVSIPKFQSANTIDLKPVLKGLKLDALFTPGFLQRSFRNSDELKLDEMFHRTEFEINSLGSEEALLGGDDERKVVVSDQNEPIPFNLKPIQNVKSFIYFVKDIQTGAILLMGRYSS